MSIAIAMEANNDKNLQQLKEYFETFSGVPLTNADVLEIADSLFYLGRAIVRYQKLKQKRQDNGAKQAGSDASPKQTILT